MTTLSLVAATAQDNLGQVQLLLLIVNGVLMSAPDKGSLTLQWGPEKHPYPPIVLILW